MEKFTYEKFRNIDVNNPFFDSLKRDYLEFVQWFSNKATLDESAYIQTVAGNIEGFLYLKVEEGDITDISPPLSVEKSVKIGTFKINPHGTRLGERFIKKSIDFALGHDIKTVYVTVFEKHKALMDIFLKYGFKVYGSKESSNGIETVLVKNLDGEFEDVFLGYPRINLENCNKYLLAIYPEYHTLLFPDSKLFTESFDIVKDVSHTNSIRKVYISKIQATAGLKKGDILVIYRTKPQNDAGSAEYRSVATSICVVEDVKSIYTYKTLELFKAACESYSVFEESELTEMYTSQKPHYIIRMTYNVALKKRIIRKFLADNCKIDRKLRWSFIPITDEQLKNIIELGEVNESYIVN